MLRKEIIDNLYLKNPSQIEVTDQGILIKLDPSAYYKNELELMIQRVSQMKLLWSIENSKSSIKYEDLANFDSGYEYLISLGVKEDIAFNNWFWELADDFRSLIVKAKKYMEIINRPVVQETADDFYNKLGHKGD